MIKVGFIDYYLDEWHANSYPELIKKCSGGRYEVCYAYAKIDSPIGGMTSKEWSEKYNIPLVDTIEELIEKSDRIIVLSPDNPEMHEELTEKALQSGKLDYVDKTFAPDKDTAIRIFENAKAHNTKCFSSSALRFSTEFKDVDKSAIDAIYCESTGYYDVYLIHQIEPIVCLMEERAKRVMYTGNGFHHSAIIEFVDGRRAMLHFYYEIPFRFTFVDNEHKARHIEIESDFFELFIHALIKFFDTGEIPVPYEQTIDVIAIRAALMDALEKPFEWIEI